MDFFLGDAHKIHNVIFNFIPQIEQYVILMHDKTSECTKVNNAQKNLLIRKEKKQ